ncbi:hypothetical protein G6F65_018320 [Rhizopus arrhizus]|nr:hypothetical protein G6F65_018320 [Rhizopus arrhizus]
MDAAGFGICRVPGKRSRIEAVPRLLPWGFPNAQAPRLCRAAGRAGRAAQRARLVAARGFPPAFPTPAGPPSMAVVPAVRAGLPRIGREGLDRAAAGAVLPEPRRHAYLAGAGRPGFWAFEKRQADCLPQRGPAGQGARAGGVSGRAWRRAAGAGRRADAGDGTRAGRHGRQAGRRHLHPQRRGGRLPPVHRSLVRPPAGAGQCGMRHVQSGRRPARAGPAPHAGA